MGLFGREGAVSSLNKSLKQTLVSPFVLCTLYDLLYSDYGVRDLVYCTCVRYTVLVCRGLTQQDGRYVRICAELRIPVCTHPWPLHTVDERIMCDGRMFSYSSASAHGLVLQL